MVHAHPAAMVAYSVAKEPPSGRVLSQTHQTCGGIGVAPYAPPGSEALGESIAGVFATGANCVVMENHGVVVGGPNLEAAFDRFETLELTARILIAAAQLGEPRELIDEQLALADQAHSNATDAAGGGAAVGESSVTNYLREYVGRAWRRGLLTRATGAFSARLGDGHFAISSDRWDADPPHKTTFRSRPSMATRRSSA